MSTPDHYAYDCLEHAVSEHDSYIRRDKIELDVKDMTATFTCKATGEILFRVPAHTSAEQVLCIIGLVNEAYREGIREGYARARNHLDTIRR